MLSLYLRLIRVQIRSQLHFRTSFLFEMIGTALITTFEFGSLALVLQRFGGIQGWTVGEVAFLYGLVEMSFGLMDMIFSGFDPPNFGKFVRQGLFDQLLLRPVNITVQVLGSEFTLRRVGKIAMGAAIFALAVSLTDLTWTPAKVLYLPFVVLGMILFFGGLFIIGATITFWTVESIEVMNILTYGGSYTISHPMHIYQDWLRRFFTYFVPAIFLNYYPALYFLNKPDPFNFPPFAPFLSPIVGLAVFLFALAFWRFGMRHYQSTGT
ncbi:MAG: ABC-2 family transporter protein [Anaerolineales bacterium]|nr:ABC-2 family transporter protein [Anaerolineales bacterium]